MNKRLIKLVILIMLFLNLISITYACDPVNIERSYPAYGGTPRPKGYEAYVGVTVTAGSVVTWDVYASSPNVVISSSTHSGGIGDGYCDIVIYSNTAGNYNITITGIGSGVDNTDEEVFNLVVNEVSSVTVEPSVVVTGEWVSFTAISNPSHSLLDTQWQVRRSEDGSSWDNYTSIFSDTYDMYYDPAGPYDNPLYAAFHDCGYYQTRARNGIYDSWHESDVVKVSHIIISKCSSGFIPSGGPNTSVDDNTTTFTAHLGSEVLAPIKFTLYDVSDEPGYCMNKPSTIPDSGEDSDSWKDIQFPSQSGFTISGSGNSIATTTSSVNYATVTVKSYDCGAYGKIKAEAQISGVWYTAINEDGTDLFARIPLDDDDNKIADNWTYNAGNATDDTDTSLNNTHNGDGLTRYEEYRGIDIDGDGKISSNERLNPSKKDLFVQGTGFGGTFPSFSWGNAFNEAGIDVHEFTGTFGTDDRNIDVLVVEAYDGTAPGNSGQIGRSGPPISGKRQWYWATHGQSDVGTSSQYGSSIGYTRVYKVAINNRFNQKPYIDNNTWTAAGTWGGASNGILDSIVPERIEDTDDDGVLDPNEKNGNTSAPHDDGDANFDGDYPVWTGTAWEFTHDLSPHDIDNDGSIELPFAASVGTITNDYTKDHVVMRTANHEMGHSVGINGSFGGHCNDSTCCMYHSSPNYERHGHFCNNCRAMIYIHNN